MRAAFATSRSALIGALALSLTASPLSAATNYFTHAPTPMDYAGAHGAQLIVATRTGSAAPTPIKCDAADQSDDYDSATFSGAIDTMLAPMAEPSCDIARTFLSRGGVLPPHSLVEQRTCLRL